MDKKSLKDIVQQLKKIVDVLESEVYSDPHAYEIWNPMSIPNNLWDMNTTMMMTGLQTNDY